MKKIAYGIAAGLAAAMLIAAPASAKPMHHVHGLDQYGCRWEARSTVYHCYRGANAGRRFGSQEEMMSEQRTTPVAAYRGRGERLVPVYVDDDGAPRPMAPMALRGHERLEPSDDTYVYPIFYGYNW